jgi:hypothetical protein
MKSVNATLSEANKKAWTQERRSAFAEKMKGAGNPNWKGGRSVASNGYVLIKVGVDHPLADVRGYAYEHRLVASAQLGRPLRPGELAHHEDEDPLNNAPSNVIPVASRAEHALLHRKRDKGLRLPGQANDLVACECGCGVTFLRFDPQGRPRRFIPGHNNNLRRR